MRVVRAQGLEVPHRLDMNLLCQNHERAEVIAQYQLRISDDPGTCRFRSNRKLVKLKGVVTFWVTG